MHKRWDGIRWTLANKAQHMLDNSPIGSKIKQYNSGKRSLSRMHSPTQTEPYCPHTSSTYIFNKPRSWCIFQQWELLDGSYRSTAVKAVQQCNTQHVIQSWGKVFHSPPAHTQQGENQSVFICPEDSREHRSSIIHVICGDTEWTDIR